MNNVQGTIDSFRGVEALKGKKDAGTIETVSKEIESMFILELIKTMKKGVGTTYGKGLGGDVYMSLFDTELSRTLSERGIGLRKIFVKELTRLSEKKGAVSPSGLKKTAESTDKST
ncbi:MAG: hypothetical protein HQL01_07120 [Nitrospirae bacterium]|nr:hypothetical protein [Nitrospirota bacterium]